MPRIAVEFCPCERNLPADHDVETSEFFVSCVRGKKWFPVLGPYATHGEALANVDRGRAMAEEKDPWCVFDAFGTMKIEKGKLKGVLRI